MGRLDGPPMAERGGRGCKPDLTALGVKLCDFGLARKVPDVRHYAQTGSVHKIPFTGLVGTMGFMAPEILSEKA